MTQAEVDYSSLDEEQARYALQLQERLNFLEEKDAAKSNFLTYVKKMWPDFIEGNHHKIYAKKLQDIATGKLKRLIINMPPRHTKSEFASIYFPSYMLGLNPK